MRALRMCYGCKMPGHDSKDCQTCKTCGLPKHSTYKCSDYSYCLRCKQLGHFASDCTNKRVTDPCRKCGMTFHVTEQCPSILHAYVDEQPAKRDVISYCYNCASKGHYGDECPDLAVDLHNLPSAFSKYNVSKGSRFDIRKIRNSPPLRDSSQSNRNDYSRYNNNRIDNAYKKRYIEDETEDDDIDHFFKGRKTKKPKQKKKAKEDNRHIHFNQRSESPVLNEFFSNKKPQQRSGNSNWKALNQNILPQPSRSGTVSFDVHSRGSRNTHLPKPSSSGYIDLTLDDDYKTRGPKYHGGYRRK
ncbi:hypothetical protein BDB01DRAFT_470066 [Pilobolus umbonatus]|nr:hypothetical protein BDB01DRAFT_470066 [Pilobolus umbonatus]